MKKDEDRAALVSVLWSFAFLIGMFIAAFASRAYGITLMAVSTIILILYLRWDDRLEHERQRRRRYEEDCERRTREARK
jgi:steroid 5-alpha reductase family enzyme